MDIKNILVIRTHRLGDILQLTPMFQGLKAQYPASNIFFLTDEEYVPLISGNSCIDAIIPIPEKECRYILKNKPDDYRHLFNDFFDLIAELRKINFDLIINRQYEFGAILAYLIGAPHIYGGSYTPQRGHFFDDRFTEELFDLIRNDRRNNQRNLVDWACLLAGIKENFFRKINFPISAYSLEEAKMLTCDKFTAGDAVIGVQMGAAKSFRQWGANNFIPVLQWLTEKQGKKIILTGSADEKEDASLVVQTLADGSCLDLTGKTSLPALAAVIAQCQLFLTPDTGIMHIASAVGTPLLALFYGGAYPWETGPYGPGNFILWPDVSCAPCRDPLFCSHNFQCKESLTPAVVITALDAISAAQKKGEISWESPNAVQLLVTANDGSEQILVPAARKTKLPSLWPEATASLTVNELSPGLLLAQSEEIKKQLLDGSTEKVFIDFADFFNNFSLYSTQRGKGIPSTWNELCSKFSEAVGNKDKVLVGDLIQSAIEPILVKWQTIGNDYEE